MMKRKAKQIQQKSRQYEVKRLTPNSYRVSDPDSGRAYIVNLGLNGGTCSCPWGQYRPDDDRRSGCSHVVAAMNYRAEKKGRRISAWTSINAARRQHRPILPIGDGLILTSRRD
jgi:hypothetical protein